MKKVFIILGMHRSGTSLMSQICRYMGAYLGEDNELIGASNDNLDGFFENLEISCADNNILHLLNRGWYSLKPIEIDYNNLEVKRIIYGLKQCVLNLFEKSDVIAIKDPRIALLLPIWEQFFHDFEVEVKYIWIFRNPLEVAESLKKRNGFCKKHSLMLWINYNLSIIRFLKSRTYLLINYKDIIEKCSEIDKLEKVFNRELDEYSRRRINLIIKSKYCHSNYSNYDVMNIQNKLLTDFYKALLRKEEFKIDVEDWERQYKSEINVMNNKYIDYDVLENNKCLEKYRIIIYGAGNYGKQAAKMLRQLGFLKYDFCDKDLQKHGMIILGGKVLDISEIENESNLLIIIAIEEEEIIKEVEQTLNCIPGTRLLSFFALKTIWKYLLNEYSSMESNAQVLAFWHEKMMARWICIKNACASPVLVYQNGKVGSVAISHSLKKAGISNAHIHRFFMKNDRVGELILGEEKLDFVKNSNAYLFQSEEYVKRIRKEMKGKKIITMVRDPIAVNLSTVFQWIGNGVADRYFTNQLKDGQTFTQAVSKLMVRIQRRLFEWFDEELMELCGVNVIEYPFDKEKGYSIIIENNVEILILRTEDLSRMSDTIKKFVGIQQFELMKENVGITKGYAHIYDKIKKELKLPREYVEYYYKDNLYMDHFYSKEEQNRFYNKWKYCIE